MLWKFFYAGSQIRAVQIRAMRNRASRGMTVEFISKYYLICPKIVLHMDMIFRRIYRYLIVFAL